MNSDFNITLLLVKVGGGLAGSIISLSVLIPATRRDALARTSVGVLGSVLLTTPLSDLIGWGEHGIEYTLAASGLIAFAAWFLFGLAARTASEWRTVQDALRDLQRIRNLKNGDSDD